MYSKVNEQSRQKSHQPVSILLAEADPAKIAQVASFTEQFFQSSIRVCNIYVDLFPMLKEKLPELLLLGILDRLNAFDICQECHQIWTGLPIVLLSRHDSIDDYFHHFRKLAMTKGATDVVTNDLLQLDKLLQGLPLKTAIGKTIAPTTSAVSVQMMLTALQEITEVGNNYFGPLAQGNYWRKAHARIVAEFPALQNWSVDHFGIISCNETMLQSQCTEEDLQSLRSWVIDYIRECERIIIDFGKILKNSHLSPATHQLLIDLVSFN